MSDQSTSRRSLLAGGVVGSAFGGLVLATQDAAAAVGIPAEPSVDFFLDLAGIPGESIDSQFPNTFDTLDWSLGATTSVGPEKPGGARHKVRPQPFTFVKHVDKASAKLFLSCATGEHIKSATLTCRKRSAKQQYLKVTLHDVYISSYRSAPSSTDAVPLDVVGLDYAALRITYTPQNPDGSLGKPIVAEFDFVKNKVL